MPPLPRSSTLLPANKSVLGLLVNYNSNELLLIALADCSVNGAIFLQQSSLHQFLPNVSTLGM